MCAAKSSFMCCTADIFKVHVGSTVVVQSSQRNTVH